MQQAYGLSGDDSVLQKTPFSFDVSVWEFFWPLMTGARLVVAAPGDHRDPARLVALIERASQRCTSCPRCSRPSCSTPGGALCQPQAHRLQRRSTAGGCPAAGLCAPAASRALQPLRPHRSRHRRHPLDLHRRRQGRRADWPTDCQPGLLHPRCQPGTGPHQVLGELYLAGAGLARVTTVARPSLPSASSPIPSWTASACTAPVTWRAIARTA